MARRRRGVVDSRAVGREIRSGNLTQRGWRRDCNVVGGEGRDLRRGRRGGRRKKGKWKEGWSAGAALVFELVARARPYRKILLSIRGQVYGAQTKSVYEYKADGGRERGGRKNLQANVPQTSRAAVSREGASRSTRRACLSETKKDIPSHSSQPHLEGIWSWEYGCFQRVLKIAGQWRASSGSRGLTRPRLLGGRRVHSSSVIRSINDEPRFCEIWLLFVHTTRPQISDSTLQRGTAPGHLHLQCELERRQPDAWSACAHFGPDAVNHPRGLKIGFCMKHRGIITPITRRGVGERAPVAVPDEALASRAIPQTEKARSWVLPSCVGPGIGS